MTQLSFREKNPDATLGYTGHMVSPEHPLPVTGVSEGGLPVSIGRNHSGQVKANYAGLSITGFVDSVNKDFPIASSVATLSTAPTTTWPEGNGSSYNPDFFDLTNTRLRENNFPGQVTTWRLDGNFSGKGAGNNGAVSLEIYNPDSGFTNTQLVTLPSSTTANTWTVNLLTIADPDSLAAGKGYLIRARTSFTDANIQFTIESITRVSQATENVIV